ncbi:DUF4190 domain-containing protein [Nocardioides sp.]|uniref:DUF4190 domain-containing protein n=1 Tax=Nocardioides sp. TaxID=35761 RepID=UPI00263270E3|nr:DUF4190 domain-containing protein [Nocardioides sp.]
MAPPAPSAGPTDGVSIAALVCAVVGCAAPAAIVLGAIGLTRTGPGKRRGRGLALAGLIIGSVVCLLAATALVAGVVVAGSTLNDTPDGADLHAGQCVDIDWADTPGLTSCAGKHDGEIIWTGQMTASQMVAWKSSEYVDDFCYAQADIADKYAATAAATAYQIDYWADTFWGEPKTGAWMVCYVTAASGKLVGPVPDDSASLSPM